MKVKTLRSHITFIICTIVTIALLCSGLFFYVKTSSVLTENYKQLVLQQLEQTNKQVSEQINLIDSLPPLFLSSTPIRDALDPSYPHAKIPYLEQKLAVERQLSYLLINNYLWNEKLIDAVYIFDKSSNIYCMTRDGKQSVLENNKKIWKSIDSAETGLVIKTLEGDENSIYFVRNIFSIYTGEPIASILININQKAWTRYYSDNLNEDWFVCLYNKEKNLLSLEDMEPYTELLLTTVRNPHSEDLQELTLDGSNYFIASKKISNADIISIVAAPKAQIFEELNSTLKTYVFVLVAVLMAALFISVILSQAITKPIEKMIYYVKRISQGNKEKMPALEMYSEFNQFADAFNHMLEQLDLYYTDNFEKQLLLKSAEIQALQSQMDPHFLFNVLNTIAWKAQMTENEEIYQMVISLGELLKMNTFSKTSAFLPLKDEIRYVRFYIYLQKMRFEDKISVEIQADSSLSDYLIPCFCIQPLVENAIVHGLEPKKDPGKLIINIIPTKDYMEISVIDNGIGFEELPDIQNIKPSTQDSHTHIGLRNLDKRLFLLFGESSRLQITSIPNMCTTISFKIPYQTENE